MAAQPLSRLPLAGYVVVSPRVGLGILVSEAPAERLAHVAAAGHVPHVLRQAGVVDVQAPLLQAWRILLATS